MNRNLLLFRKNCEGYFLDKNKMILAQNSTSGYIIFPRGVNENETPEEGLLREAFEETGVIINGRLKNLGILYITQDKNWAKTEKQKIRYKKYKGDEMHFFFGKIKKFKEQRAMQKIQMKVMYGMVKN